jgi:hypothetical protein
LYLFFFILSVSILQAHATTGATMDVDDEEERMGWRWR